MLGIHCSDGHTGRLQYVKIDRILIERHSPDDLTRRECVVSAGATNIYTALSLSVESAWSAKYCHSVHVPLLTQCSVPQQYQGLFLTRLIAIIAAPPRKLCSQSRIGTKGQIVAACNSQKAP